MAAPRSNLRTPPATAAAAYVGTASDRLRIGRDRRYTDGPLDLDAEGARIVARLLLAWAETRDLGQTAGLWAAKPIDGQTVGGERG